MALIYNALPVEQQVRVHGSWFTFKPNAIKELDEAKAFFLVSTRQHEGFVSLPDEMSDLEYKQSQAGKDILKAAEKSGREARVAFLKNLIHNETVSLQRDIDQKGLKYDARLEMSPQMIKQIEELAGYQKGHKAAENDKVKKIQELEALLEE